MPQPHPTGPPRNVCAGPFGAVYDFYIERPRLARLVLGAMWGVDPAPFYRSLAAIREIPEDATVLDVPCGGGVAMRGLRPGQRVSWIGVDLEPAMLRRAERRAARFPNLRARFIRADMSQLPLDDQLAHLCLSYGGLHCLSEPEACLSEMVRCLRPGGTLIGSTFVADGTRRQRRLLQADDFGRVPTAEELKSWLGRCGLADISLDRGEGLVLFEASRPPR
jgi:SAM-dependent methyltransferase